MVERIDERKARIKNRPVWGRKHEKIDVNLD